MAKKLGWNLNQMPEKMVAAATFHGELARTLGADLTAKTRIANAGANIISKYFDAYMDHMAKVDKYRYHHLYEFGMTGSKEGRLFKSTVKNGAVSYDFLDSTRPNSNGAIFTKKVFIMEAGDPIEILPKKSQFLVYDLNGEVIFSKGSYVAHPGGAYVAQAFHDAFNEFFTSNSAKKVLMDAGFYDILGKGIDKAIKGAIPRINAGALNSAAAEAVNAAYGIVSEVEDIGNRL